MGVILQPNSEDKEWAVAQDSGKCLYVRTIQRQIPEALFVRVDAKEMSWTNAETKVREYWTTPPEAIENVIKPLDEGRAEDIKLEPILLTNLIESKDTRKDQSVRAAGRQKNRVRTVKEARKGGGKPKDFHRRNRFPA